MNNFTPYVGDESFLTGSTKTTDELWDQVMDLTKQERDNGGVLDMDTAIVSTITSHGPGYLNKNKEKIVGFQTDKPFKRSLQPFDGMCMDVGSAESYGFNTDGQLEHIYIDT